MQCTLLRTRFELLRLFAGFSSLDEFARSMGVPTTTMRSWFQDQGGGIYNIPESRETQVFGFISSILPGKPHPEFVKQLFLAPLVHLQNALLPPGGQLLHRFIHTRLSDGPLNFRSLASLPKTIERHDEELIEADHMVTTGQPFEMSLDAPWSGEGTLLRETDGQWHVVRMADKLATSTFKCGRWMMPGTDKVGVRRCLRVRDLPGLHQYYAICVLGSFDHAVRQHLAGPQPLDRYTLDAIASALLLLPASSMRLATTRVEVLRTAWSGKL